MVEIHLTMQGTYGFWHWENRSHVAGQLSLHITTESPCAMWKICMMERISRVSHIKDKWSQINKHTYIHENKCIACGKAILLSTVQTVVQKVLQQWKLQRRSACGVCSPLPSSLLFSLVSLLVDNGVGVSWSSLPTFRILGALSLSISGQFLLSGLALVCKV